MQAFRKRYKGKAFLWLMGLLTAAACLAGGSLWMMRSKTVHHTHPLLVYTSQGFGGFVRVRPGSSSVRSQSHATDPLQAAADAYEKGQYQAAEVLAQKIIVKAKNARPGSDASRQALLARQVAAYSAARRKDFKRAQQRFAELRDAASELLDHGRQPTEPGERLPTLEEEAAYQHAVCTGVLQGPKAAEAEYSRFLCRYPQSVLLSGTIKRIARYHQGNIPKPAEKLWQQAMQVQKEADKRQKREASLCGPECLAELLRRRGEKVDAHALADAMGTNEEGTSLAAVAKIAKRYGYAPRGLLLTERGLAKQPLPAIAFAQWGHYVIVEAVSPKSVQVWDPDAFGAHHPGRKSYSQKQWQTMWAGYTLALR